MSASGNQDYKKFVFVPVALSGLAIGVIMPILTPLTRSLNLADSQGGAIVSIGSVAMALTASAWGRYSDRYGRRAGILAGFAGLSLSYALFVLVTLAGLQGLMTGTALFLSLVFARVLVGAALPAIPASAQALIADNTDESERGGAMALIGLANGVGLVVGPAFGGALALMGLIWPLVVTCLLCAFGFMLIYLRMPNAGFSAQESVSDKPQLTHALATWIFMGFLTVTTIVTLQVCAGYYIQDRLTVTGAAAARYLALALTSTGVALILFQVVQMKWLKWSELRLGLVAPFVMVLGLAILLSTASIGAYCLAYAIMGVGAGMSMTAISAGAANAVGPAHQGLVGGYIAASHGAAAIVAPISSTLIYEQSVELPFFLLMGLAALAFVIVLVLALRRGERQSA